MSHHPLSAQRPTPAGESEKETEVVRNANAPIRSTTNQTACLVQIYPADTGLGRLYAVDRPLVLGRDAECAIRLEESSVSRCHARVVPREDGCYVADLRSTNGTFVNDKPAFVRKLEDGDYLRVGSHIYRFLTSGNIEADYHEEIYRLTITDALTGTHNKRFFLDFLERELSRAVRHRRPLALVLFDIDHFKAVNDTHGHLAGDAVLRGLAARLRPEIRRDELFARYGGEEFAVVLPETGPDGAFQMAQRLRESTAAYPFDHNRQPLPITISLGAAATSGEEAIPPLEFLGRADEKLYQAKHRGRNCVVA